MKRFFIPVMLIFVLLLTACGSSSNNNSTGSSGGATQGLSGGNNYIGCPSNTNTKAAAPESGTVTLNVAGATSSPAEEALVVANLNKFQQLHPNIKINWQDIASNYTDKMRANVAAGTVPDVFYFQPNMATEYIPAGKTLNLSPYMARDHVSTSEYYSSLLSPFSCKNGEVFGLPKDWNSLGVFYNKQMFQAAGIPFPTANWTWSDMQNDAKKLTKPGNAGSAVYGLTLAPDASRWGAFLFANGGSVLNKDGTQAAFNNTAGVNSLNFFASFEKTGSSVVPANVGAGWAGDAFGKQRGAMAIEGGWLIPYMTANFPGVQYGIAPLPVAPTGNRADLIYTNAWAAYSGTQHADAAWELIKYMCGQDVQASQLHAGFALPSLKSLASDPYFTQNPGVKVLFDAATYGYADNYGPDDTNIHTDLSDAIEKVFLGKADSQTALNEAAQQINTDLQTGP